MNRIKLINRIDNYNYNQNSLKYYKYYIKKDNLSSSKCSKCKSKVLKSKIKSKKQINAIKVKNVKLAMYGIY